jgi:putative oxidoreductase
LKNNISNSFNTQKIKMKKYQEVGTLLLRIAMAATFLSAVASRLSLLGKASSGWDDFLVYTGHLLPFAPKQLIPMLAVSSTVLEITFSLLLLAGWKTRQAATGAACLLLLFALSMAGADGIKSPLDYSVFADAAACFLLASFSYYRCSIDAVLEKNKTII